MAPTTSKSGIYMTAICLIIKFISPKCVKLYDIAVHLVSTLDA